MHITVFRSVRCTAETVSPISFYIILISFWNNKINAFFYFALMYGDISNWIKTKQAVRRRAGGCNAILHCIASRARLPITVKQNIIWHAGTRYKRCRRFIIPIRIHNSGSGYITKINNTKSSREILHRWTWISFWDRKLGGLMHNAYIL